MTREELLNFVRDFNQSGPISMASIAECLKALPKKALKMTENVQLKI